MDIKIFIKWLLIAWFIIFSMVVFIPTFKLIFSKETNIVIPQDSVPKPPNSPKAFAISVPNNIDTEEGRKKYIEVLTTKVEAFKQEVAVYETNVKGYSAQIEAIKVYNNTFKILTLKDIYSTIVNDKLLNILQSLITAFIAYVFVKGGTNLYFNKKAAETSAPLEHFSLF